MKIPIEGEDRPGPADEKRKNGIDEEGPVKETVPGADQAAQGEPGDMKDKTSEEIQRLLAEKTREAEENYQQNLRLRAEFENFRKRMESEHLKRVERANEVLVQALLPVLDSLERAGKFADGHDKSEAVLEGLGIILQQLKEVLEKAGLKEIQTVGEPFDPNLHEAIMVVDVEPEMDNVVVDEMQKGYIFKESVLRPAKVTVGKVREG